MSAAKHTPGPWHVAAGNQIRSALHQVARVWMMRSGEGVANARLIAAAPELLDTTNALLFVVRALATELGIDPETTEFRFKANGEQIATVLLATAYERAEAAIAKATGSVS